MKYDIFKQKNMFAVYLMRNELFNGLNYLLELKNNPKTTTLSPVYQTNLSLSGFPQKQNTKIYLP